MNPPIASKGIIPLWTTHRNPIEASWETPSSEGDLPLLPARLVVVSGCLISSALSFALAGAQNPLIARIVQDVSRCRSGPDRRGLPRRRFSHALSSKIDLRGSAEIALDATARSFKGLRRPSCGCERARTPLAEIQCGIKSALVGGPRGCVALLESRAGWLIAGY